MLKREFLSCLYGSEPVRPRRAAICAFLSCLYGSEQPNFLITSIRDFLSCLYGSELKGNNAILLLANKIINFYA